MGIHLSEIYTFLGLSLLLNFLHLALVIASLSNWSSCLEQFETPTLNFAFLMEDFALLSV